MRVSDQLTIIPTELVAGGAALARIDGFPIFATNVYPGDVAVVRITEAKKGFARAEMVRIVRPSELRRVMPCPIAEECGGCDWTSLRLDAQLAAKERILRESLRRIGKVYEHPPITLHPSPLNYRLRSRLHRQVLAGEGAGAPPSGEIVGFYATESHRVVPLAKECEVVGIETAKAAQWGAGALAGEIWEIDGRLITDEREITIRVGPFTYLLSTSSFFQVNRHLLATMLRLVTAHAARVKRKQTAIDLFAGVGFFSLPLATMFERVISVEGSFVSHRYLRINAPANVEAIHAPAESYDCPDADFIILDPPRAGAHRGVIDAIGRRAKEMICYLSCDPVTFSRDASRLIASGWRLATLDLLDLFPNTHHVETLASLERAQ